MAREELKQKFSTGSIPTGADFAELIDIVGQPGEKGDPGEPGAPGADGFGTEAQYNDIISRLDALEGGGV